MKLEGIHNLDRKEEVLSLLEDAKLRAIAIFDAPIWKLDGAEHEAHRRAVLRHGESEAYVAAMLFVVHPEHVPPTVDPRDIFIGLFIHDIGKIGAVADPVVWHLRRPQIAVEDLSNMQRHVELGYEILLRYQKQTGVVLPEVVLDILLHHHEKLDGSGRPLGVTGDQLSYAARLAVIIDQIIARCEPRKYHDHDFSLRESYMDVARDAGVKYDAGILGDLEALFRSNEHLRYQKLAWLGTWE
ncbi:MAG: HD domain-containing phosphohydrolase [Patescibacteria group bacterium]